MLPSTVGSRLLTTAQKLKTFTTTAVVRFSPPAPPPPPKKKKKKKKKKKTTRTILLCKALTITSGFPVFPVNLNNQCVQVFTLNDSANQRLERILRRSRYESRIVDTPNILT